MKICILTDMEGLAGVDDWEQCYAEDDQAPNYQFGLEQLAADTNAAVAGCFDAGATEVVVWDGHGRNRQKAFSQGSLDARATFRRVDGGPPVCLEGLDGNTDAVLMVGQHAMAGTIGGFLDHTQCPKEICRYLINGSEHGEMSQFALQAGTFGSPLVHVSGDEALCSEARRLFPWVATTPTKRGINWETCELYPVEAVRSKLRREVANAIAQRAQARVWTLPAPVEITVEYGWTALADRFDGIPGVRRLSARTVAWKITDLRFVHSWPSATWTPS